MANNPYVNKVELADGTPIMDISSDTVSSASLMEGYTAHDASGAPIVGTARGGADDGYVWQDGQGYVHLSDNQGTDFVGNIIADPYDSTATYAVGDYCAYNGLFYRCTTAIATAEAWNANHWTQTVVVDELQSQPSGGDQIALLQIDETIAVADWVLTNGSYVATIVNASISSNMTGVDVWLTTPDPILDEALFETSNGSLTIAVTNRPTAVWNLHLLIGENGAEVLDDVSDLQEDVASLYTQIENLNSKVVVTATLTTSSYGVYATAATGYSLTSVKADMVAVGYRVTSGSMSSLTSDITVTTSVGQVSVACTSAPIASVTLEIYLI